MNVASSNLEFFAIAAGQLTGSSFGTVCRKKIDNFAISSVRSAASMHHPVLRRLFRATQRHSLPLLLGLGFAFLAPILSADPATPDRPNILFIYADDQPYKSVGCYPGSWSWVKTPNLDALAKTGIRFDAAYMGSWCMPSRSIMLTGRQPHGIESMRLLGKNPASTYDPAQTPFFPAELRKAGYHTAQIGKWHTGPDTGFGRDWDRQLVWNHALGKGAYFGPQTVSIDGREERVDGYSTDNYTKWAVDYIRGTARDRSKPWYLWLCYGAVHGPSTPAERHQGKYRGAPVPVPADILPPRENKPPYWKGMQAWERDADGEIVANRGTGVTTKDGQPRRATLAESVQLINECALAIDEGVAKLVQALRETGQLENTLVVYTADQGFAFGEHGMRAKVAPYDANYRSPLIISQPGRLPQGRACTAPVNGTDLVATYCALAGAKAPRKLHGRDLTPLLRNPDLAWRQPTLYEHTGGTYGRAVAQTLRERPAEATYAGVPWYVAVVQERLKFVHYLQPGNGEELFDLHHDPDELRNLINDPAYRGRRETLRAALAAELVRTEAGFGLTEPRR